MTEHPRKPSLFPITSDEIEADVVILRALQRGRDEIDAREAVEAPPAPQQGEADPAS